MWLVIRFPLLNSRYSNIQTEKYLLKLQCFWGSFKVKISLVTNYLWGPIGLMWTNDIHFAATENEF